MYGTARAGKTTADVLSILDREIDRVTRDVVSDDELARAKARLELSLLQSLETMSGKAEQIGFFETVLGEPAAAFRRLEGYRRSTASDLRKAARRYLSGQGRTLIRVLPESAT